MISNILLINVIHMILTMSVRTFISITVFFFYVTSTAHVIAWTSQAMVVTNMLKVFAAVNKMKKLNYVIEIPLPAVQVIGHIWPPPNPHPTPPP